MLSQRWRPVVFSLVAVVVIWAISLTGYKLAHNWRVTADKLQAYIERVDLSTLSGAARAKAIKDLARKVNALSVDERRKARMEGIVWPWFEKMTEDEKAGFIEETMPTGFQQMLSSFEQMPADKRRMAVEDALRRMKQAGERLQSDGVVSPPPGTNGLALSPELQAKVRTIGLKAFYSQSSAQTKAELAPVLEELQRVMESGRPFRR